VTVVSSSIPACDRRLRKCAEAARRPTRFERPHQYSILRELRDTVERAAVRLSFEVPSSPVIGTLPTGSLDPLMVRVPGARDVLVLVDGSLLTYANLLGKAVAQTLPFDLSDYGDLTGVAPAAAAGGPIDPRGTGCRRFVELVQATLDGDPAGAPPYLPEARYEAGAADLCDFMELFVLAREFARVIDGDHLSARSRRRTVHGHAFDVLTWSAEQELKADCLGLTLLLAAADVLGASLAWAFCAADVLLASYGMIDRARWLAGFSRGCPMAAPPTLHDDRRRALCDFLSRSESGARAVACRAGLQPVLDVLEGALESHRHGARATGAVVH
jgi:hypothetical protein